MQCSLPADRHYHPKSWHKWSVWAPLRCTVVPAHAYRRTWIPAVEDLGRKSSSRLCVPRLYWSLLRPPHRSVSGCKKPKPSRRNRGKTCPWPWSWARRTLSWLWWLEKSFVWCAGLMIGAKVCARGTVDATVALSWLDHLTVSKVRWKTGKKISPWTKCTASAVCGVTQILK